MAAVLTPRTDLTAPLEPAPWNAPGPRGAGRRHLRLVEGGAGTARPTSTAPVRAGLGRVAATLVAGLAVAALVALASLGAVQLLGADAAASGPASTAGPLHPAGAGASTSSAPAVVVVESGDTLWSIARTLRPTGDVRPVVDELAARNGGVGLVVGQTLDVSGLAG